PGRNSRSYCCENMRCNFQGEEPKCGRITIHLGTSNMKGHNIRQNGEILCNFVKK
ncbi:hypothetical protein POVCU1_002700, partial [Plasmodium ovale curtisi]